MDVSNGGQTKSLNSQSLNHFTEAISLILSRWTALQLVVQNQCGGRDSSQKYHELASSILSWFVNSKGPLYIDDLEEGLYTFISDNFYADFQDGSVEEVAEHLMTVHEDCLNGNLETIEKLRTSGPGTSAVQRSQREMNDNESSDDEVEESQDMLVDEPTKPAMLLQNQKQKPVPDEDGFIPVVSKKNKGRK